MKNIEKMLLMYLEEHGIRAYPKQNKYLRGFQSDDPNRNNITVFLKHADIDNTIELSIMQTELQINGTKVCGKSQKSRKYGGYDIVFDEIADLADPQAFERIRMWIRNEEKTMRYSTSVAQAAMRLKASAYAISSPEVLDEDLKNFKQLHGDVVDLRSAIGNVEIQPPYELPKKG